MRKGIQRIAWKPNRERQKDGGEHSSIHTLCTWAKVGAVAEPPQFPAVSKVRSATNPENPPA